MRKINRVFNSEIYKPLYDAIKNCPGSTNAELASAFGRTVVAVNERMQMMRRAGWVRCTQLKSPGTHWYYRWYITDIAPHFAIRTKVKQDPQSEDGNGLKIGITDEDLAYTAFCRLSRPERRQITLAVFTARFVAEKRAAREKAAA